MRPQQKRRGFLFYCHKACRFLQFTGLCYCMFALQKIMSIAVQKHSSTHSINMGNIMLLDFVIMLTNNLYFRLLLYTEKVSTKSKVK